ncbi:MAG: Rieske (2Fe-2S) protein [Gemmatimonadaceae bacterium]
MANDIQQPKGDDCSDCELATMGRRLFLQRAGFAAAAALGALGAMRSTAFAAAVSTIEPSLARGNVRSYTIPAGDGVYVDAANDVILARWQNQMYAFSLKCPHRGATLEWRQAENRVFCPKHKARFRPDGAHDSGRESRDLDRFDIRRAGTGVVVDLATVRRADNDAAAWRAAAVSVT